MISISSTEDCLVVDCGDTLSFETQDDIDADTEYASPSPCIQNSSTSASSIICSISRISPSRKRRRGSRESSGDGRKSNTRRCQFSEPSIDYYNIVSDDDLDGTPLNVPDNVEGFYPSNLLISDDKSPPFTDSRSRKRPSNIDDEVLKHRELTRATPLIRKLVRISHILKIIEILLTSALRQGTSLVRLLLLSKLMAQTMATLAWSLNANSAILPVTRRSSEGSSTKLFKSTALETSLRSRSNVTFGANLMTDRNSRKAIDLWSLMGRSISQVTMF